MFAGLSDSTLSCDDGYRFLLLGRSIERVDMMVRVLLSRASGSLRQGRSRPALALLLLQDVLLAVHVGEEELQRHHPLLDPALELVPLRRRDHPGHQIQRERALLTGQREGDALVDEGAVEHIRAPRQIRDIDGREGGEDPLYGWRNRPAWSNISSKAAAKRPGPYLWNSPVEVARPLPLARPRSRFECGPEGRPERGGEAEVMQKSCNTQRRCRVRRR